jgi:hypothetical protein
MFLGLARILGPRALPFDRPEPRPDTRSAGRPSVRSRPGDIGRSSIAPGSRAFLRAIALYLPHEIINQL